MPTGAFGAVRPVGAILPTASAAGPFSRAADGYAAPKALPASHAQMMFPPDPYPPPDCPKSPLETEILRTHIQGRKRILDSH